MGFSTLSNVRLAGLSTAVPKRTLDNIEYGIPEFAEERSRFVRNVGVKQRRIAETWQSFSDFAFLAASELIEKLSWRKDEIDALIVVTQSPDYRLPATAIILQDRLGLETSTIAFDVNLGCSAYPYGIHLVGSMIASGSIKKALLLVGDKSASPHGLLFSDAATATAIVYDESVPVSYFDLNSDGSGYEAIILKVGGAREPFEAHHFIPEPGSVPFKKSYPHELSMDGPAVLNFSISRVPNAVLEILKRSGHELSDIDYFVFHQANNMINNTIKKKLKLDDDKVPMSLEDFGNTSGATLPVTMNARLQYQLSNETSKLLMCGFGVGLSWASAIMEVGDMVVPDILEM